MSLVFSNNSKKHILKLNPRIQQKLIRELEKFSKGLRVDIKKVQGTLDEFRIRVGNFRIQIKKINKDILITKIGKRENFYLVFL